MSSSVAKSRLKARSASSRRSTWVYFRHPVLTMQAKCSKQYGKTSLHFPMVLVQCSASYTYIKLWEITHSSKTSRRNI